MLNQFNINGKTYNSLDEVPPEFRSMFEDKNNNGIPDMFEGIVQNVKTYQDNAQINTVVYNHDGKTYNDINQLPPDARQKVQDAFSKLGLTAGVNNYNPVSAPYPSLESIVSAANADKPFMSGGVIAAIIILGLLFAALMWMIFKFVL